MNTPNPYPLAKRSNKSIQELTSLARLRLAETTSVSEMVSLPKERVAGEILQILESLVIEKQFRVPQSTLRKLSTTIADDVAGLGPIEEFLQDDSVTDILINGYENITVERNGRLERVNNRFDDEEHLFNTCQRLVSRVGRRLDEGSPMCDARLPDGSRINIITKPLAYEGTQLAIRKFPKNSFELSQLVARNSINKKIEALLFLVVKARLNCIIVGGTGSGKTTLLNALAGVIQKNHRVICCEDVAELQIPSDNSVRLEARPPNIEGKGEVTIRSLVKNCLRMRPDRIIVGEVRSSEAFDLVQAMNTGHDGSMGTLHANSCYEAISRLSTLVAMSGVTIPMNLIHDMIASSIDMIIHVTRLQNGDRCIAAISEVAGMENGNVILNDIIVLDNEGINGEQRSWVQLSELSARGRAKVNLNNSSDDYKIFRLSGVE